MVFPERHALRRSLTTVDRRPARGLLDSGNGFGSGEEASPKLSGGALKTASLHARAASRGGAGRGGGAGPPGGAQQCRGSFTAAPGAGAGEELADLFALPAVQALQPTLGSFLGRCCEEPGTSSEEEEEEEEGEEEEEKEGEGEEEGGGGLDAGEGSVAGQGPGQWGEEVHEVTLQPATDPATGRCVRGASCLPACTGGLDEWRGEGGSGT